MQNVTTQEGGLCSGLPRVSLCSVLPTPLEQAARLSQVVGGTQILFKRDDLTGLSLGGNKIRNMEFIFGELLQKGCDSVITTAGVQSNMCRATAASASRLGLKCVLMLRGSGNEERQGNLLLDTLLGADVRFIPTEDPYDPRVEVWLEEAKQELERQGHCPYLLHLTGATATVATCAYVDAAEELVGQFANMKLDPDYLYLTVGSGVTMAGLVLGFKHLGMRLQVVGVSSSAKTDFLVPRIVRHANQAAGFLGLSTRVNAGDFVVHDQYIGPGYARAYPSVVDAILLVAREEGLLLDPVYTGKCMHGLLDQISQGVVEKDHTVVFLHSGGAPNLFVQHELFTQSNLI